MDNAIVNVAAELKRPGNTVCRKFECELTGLELSGRAIIPLQPIEVDLKYTFDGEGILVEGDLSAVFFENCARCGMEFRMPFKQTFRETFIREGRVNALACDCNDDMDSDAYTFSGDKLDLNDMLRDYILLNLPISSVCRKDCMGLCPVCGTNLNFGTCACRDNASGHFAKSNVGHDEAKSVLARLLSEFQDNDKEV